jgi:hypothetical protein
MMAVVRLLLTGAALFAGQFVRDPTSALAQNASAAVMTRTTAMADAANAFLATLSDTQKTAVLFDFKDAEQRVRWSNLPVGIFRRAGIAWGDLDGAQRAALIDLLGAVLGPDGMENVREQMAADDALRPPDSSGMARGGAPGGARPANPRAAQFGSEHYYVSLLGAPSATAPWMLQFGGHHLAINATIVGPNVTLSPSLTGGQPLKFVWDGRPIYIVVKEAVHGAGLLNSLTDEQRRKAVISTRLIDLVLGPGKDGRTLQPEGLPASEMDVQQKAQLLVLIEARLSIIMGADVRAAKIAAIEKNLDQTYFAWWGPATPLGGAYWRVTGPTVLLEFSPQALGGDLTQHTHNIYREPGNDYGAAWTPLK